MNETGFRRLSGILLLFVGFLFLSAGSASAQLVECEQVDTGGNVNAPGGCIARTLQDQIGPGHGDVTIPGSAVYIIKRDPARAVRRGRQLFQRKFTTAEGHGPRVNFTSTEDITQVRALGAGLADSCAACHGRPRGSAGVGGDVTTFPDSRDAPHLFGLGIVEQLGEEMTADLRAIRDQAILDAGSGSGMDTLIDADFDNGTDGFVFSGTATYASGDNPPSSVPGDSLLRVSLGNVDNASVFNMTGTWERSFAVASETDAVLSLRFNLTQAANYESDEFSDAIVTVDGVDFLLARITGNGNGGGVRTTGPVETQVNVHLVAGNHTLGLKGFNNKKTFADESTEVLFNNVLLETTGSAPGPVTRSLDTKGINFGSITAFPNGTVDTSAVDGVDSDLRIKPFFHDGRTASMREFIIGAFNDEMGMQAWDPVLCAATDPFSPTAVTSPAGFVFDPATDTIARPPACSSGEDTDGDGISGEIDPALVDHMEFYLLNYFKPGRYKITQRANDGDALMDQIGCTSCHVRNLVIDSDRRVADVETNYDPVAGIFNQLFAVGSTRFGTPINDGDPFPQLPPSQAPFTVANFFSDLKRHDLGLGFEERDFDGSRIVEHVTEPLWGAGTTAPYGHDGRSINLDQVILRHGGEAEAAKQAYVALSDDDQRKIHEFISTLVLFPPDDTASNLNPGNPAGDPQVPANHGSINLGALFQIPSEGPE